MININNHNKIITCKLNGGLGNQLFEIFRTISYALEHNKMNLLKFPNIFNEYNSRPSYWNSILFKLNDYLIDKNDYLYANSIVSRETDFKFQEFNIISDNIKFDGYYQCYKYYEDYYETIYNMLEIRQQQDNIKEKYNYDYNNTISLHLRMGDYKNAINFYNIITIDYIIDAFNYIINFSKKKNFNILCFFEKEDENAINNYINQLKEIFNDFVFQKIDTEILDYEQLLIMSNCKHNIISNSSYSYWAAYFNYNLDKIVCYPNKWFNIEGPNVNGSDICPISWININDYTKNNIIIMLICCNKNINKLQKIKYKWLEKININYVIIFGNNKLPKGSFKYDKNNRYLYLGCEDNYDELVYKVYYGIKAIKELFNPDKLFKIDDDVIINIPNFYKYIIENTKTEYEGKTIIMHKNTTSFFGLDKYTNFKNKQPIFFDRDVHYCGGPLYFLNKHSIQIISDYMNPEFSKFEDVNIGATLNNHNIYPKNTNIYVDDINGFTNNVGFHNYENFCIMNL